MIIIGEKKRMVNKSEETGQSGSMLIRRIPDDLRRAFKARCASDGISQQDKIIELMAAYVAMEKPSNNK